MEENKKLKLYSYTKVWKIEKKIYAIQNIILPVPVSPFDILAFAGTVVALMLLCRIFPPLTAIPGLLRYAVLPYALSNYLMKKKLDGQNPIKYFCGLMRHLLWERNIYLEGFKAYPLKGENMKWQWDCSRGRFESGAGKGGYSHV